MKVLRSEKAQYAMAHMSYEYEAKFGKLRSWLFDYITYDEESIEVVFAKANTASKRDVDYIAMMVYANHMPKYVPRYARHEALEMMQLHIAEINAPAEQVSKILEYLRA